MDQALDSKYNKPAKVTLGIIAWTGKNEAVYKWNLMKYEKSSYTNLFCEISGINKEHEYFLHHEFSEQPTEVDKRCVNQLDSYIQERGNPFDIKDATKTSKQEQHLVMRQHLFSWNALQKEWKIMINSQK